MKKIKELPISEYQKRFFLEWAIDPESTKYNVSLIFKLEGCLNKEALRSACENFIKNNEVVHARYSEDGEKCFYSDYSIEDFYEVKVLEESDDIFRNLKKILHRKINITKDVLHKFYLLEIGTNTYYFVLLSSHHIVVDGTCSKSIMDQVCQDYNSYIKSLPLLKPSNVQSFSNAVNIGKSILTEEFKINASKYYKRIIQDIDLSIALPYKCVNNQTTNKQRNIFFDLDKNQLIKLKIIARNNKITPFILISALYGITIYKFTSQKKFLINFPVDMRPNGYKNVTGCFVNNTLMKFNFEDNNNLQELLQDILNQRREGKKYQGYLLTDIISDQRFIRGDLPSNYFNVSFAQTNLNSATLKLDGLHVESIDFSWSDESIDELSLLYDEYSSEKLKFKLLCKRELFNDTFIESFSLLFKRLINKTIEKGNLNIQSFPSLTSQEYQTIVYG
jgi:hypothetical protein